MIIYAGNSGGLDKVDRKKVTDWEEQFLTFMKEQKPEVRALLAKEKKMTDEVIKAAGRRDRRVPAAVQGVIRASRERLAALRIGSSEHTCGSRRPTLARVRPTWPTSEPS